MLKRNSWPYLFDLNPWRRMIANLNGSDLSVCVLFQEKQEVYEKWRLWYQIYSDIFWYVLHCSDILYYILYIHIIFVIYIYTMISFDMFSIWWFLGFWSAEQVEPALQEVITSLVKSSPGLWATCGTRWPNPIWRPRVSKPPPLPHTTYTQPH